MAEFKYDFFVSRRGSAAGIAREIASVLIEDNLRPFLQDYDFAQSQTFTERMHDGLTQSRHFLLILTPDYFESAYTRDEFFNFKALQRRGAQPERRIGVLVAGPCKPDGLIAGVIYGKLHDVTDPTVRRRIILEVARFEASAGNAIDEPSPIPAYGEQKGQTFVTKTVIHGDQVNYTIKRARNVNINGG